MVSTSFLTDISNFDDCESSRSFLSDNDLLTSTPNKFPSEQEENPLPVSPLPPPFQLVDEPSFECSSSRTEQSTLDSNHGDDIVNNCLLYTSPSPRDATLSRMPSSA